MAWDTTKLTGDTLTADEWNTHVTDQKTRLVKSGDTMTSTLVIDPATDVVALKIIPENDTGGKTAIQLRNAADDTDVFLVDNTGAITAPSLTGTASVASTVIVTDTTDTSCYVGLFEDATGSLAIKTDNGITYNANTAELSTTTFIGALTGTASGNLPNSGGNLTGNLTLDSGKTVDGIDISTWRNGVGGVAALDTTRELPHHINKIASANIRNSHDTETSSQSLIYVKVKTITLTNGLIGQQRFLFDLKTSNVLNIANAKIYRNGIALGTEQSDVTGVYVTKSEDITQTWEPGDTCELWIKIDNVTETVYVQNFRIAYDDSPTVVVVSVNT